MSVSTVRKTSEIQLPFIKSTPSSIISKLNIPDVFGSDGLVQKKISNINSGGNNPFGASKINNDEKILKEGVAKKIYSLFEKIDTDKNGFLSHQEVVNKMKDGSIKTPDSAVISTLVQNGSKIANLSDDELGLENDGVTKKDIIALDKLSGSDTIKDKVENTYYNSLYKATSGKSFFDENGKFISPKKASDIDFRHIQQGGAGDCYFLAALASQAQRNPQKIVDMIKDNGDGTFNIKFSNKTVKINAPTSSELGLYADGAGWVALVEKGYAVYRNESTLLKKENPFDVSGGGSMIIGRSIKELTGNSYDTDMVKLTPKNSTRAKLTDATNNNKLMTASINKTLIGKSEFNLPDAHVYTILGFDSKTDKVKIRNPWGHTEAQDSNNNARDGRDDGIFELTIDEFYRAFSMVAYEQK